MAILILPPSKPCIAILKPWPSLPIRFFEGILTSVRDTCLVGWFFHPIFDSFFPYSIPGRSAGIRKQDIPLGPSSLVLAINIKQSVEPDPDIKALDPLII